MRRILMLCIVPTLLMACAAGAVDSKIGSEKSAASDDTPRAVSMGQPFRLAVGENVLLGEEPLEIGFTGVASDSRCPKDVQCIWQGDAVADLWVVTGDGERTEIQLHTSEEPRETVIGGHVIRLQDLEPYPVSTSPIAPEDYLATITVAQ